MQEFRISNQAKHVLSLAEEDWHMPIESSQYFIILFRVNKVFTFYHINVLSNCCYRTVVIALLLSHCCYRSAVIALWLSHCGYRTAVIALRGYRSRPSPSSSTEISEIDLNIEPVPQRTESLMCFNFIFIFHCILFMAPP